MPRAFRFSVCLLYWSWLILHTGAAALGQAFVLPQSTVPSGGVGPQAVFKVSKFEITNQQFASFLNNAQMDAGATARGSHMVFQANGQVTAPDGSLMFKPFSSSRIVYVAGSPIGSRYTPEAGFSTHPVMHVSWIGAVKFCNWLTIDQGRGLDQRAYTEGPTLADWHPVVISTADWMARDLNDAERQTLINTVFGYRLPMDNVGGEFGWVGEQENEFNEWYKMAGYDPAAPNFPRSGPADETISALHWAYGMGRDSIAANQANFLMSGDPFEFSGTTPTGYYNGSNSGTVNTNNAYLIHDLSGNVAEWMQDHGASPSLRVIRGGSWNQSSGFLTATYRSAAVVDATSQEIGFRVVRTLAPPAPPTGDYNADNMVNLIDYHAMLGCFLGPGVSYDTDGSILRIVNVGSGFSFSPANLVIEVGDTVRWDWVGGTHNVSSGAGGIHDGNFYSGPATGNSNFIFDVTFDEAFIRARPMTDNLYPYYCEPHFGFGMVGTVKANYDPCRTLDFDLDGDLDMADFVSFQIKFGS